eukprot:TRINITY_DN1446_c3_g1_i1.p1 TRINITY_DN1446_c3_g1~~TRINITY_DN1446_c3_g1_i1.p1  ORF type:complete len:638 (+),score=84.13 TRINITY_DN1446_c3_g1_i1:102-2015(+)
MSQGRLYGVEGSNGGQKLGAPTPTLSGGLPSSSAGLPSPSVGSVPSRSDLQSPTESPRTIPRLQLSNSAGSLLGVSDSLGIGRRHSVCGSLNRYILDTEDPRMNRTQSVVMDLKGRIRLAQITNKVMMKKTFIDIEPRKFTIREKMLALLDPGAEQPTKKYFAISTCIAIFIICLVVTSVVVFCVETLPQYHNDTPVALTSLEITCNVIFSIELLLRAVSVPNIKDFLRDAMTWIDILAIVPFYVSLVANHDEAGTLVVLRLLKLVRVLRVLKLGQYNQAFQIVMFTLSKSTTAVALLVFMLAIATLLYSSLLFISETWSGQTFSETDRRWYRSDGTQSPFQSIFHVFWYCMCTLTTVGYGDHYPVTIAGKIVGGFCIISGLFVVAFPVILISHNFQEIIEEAKTMEQVMRVDELATMTAISGLDSPRLVDVRIREEASELDTLSNASPRSARSCGSRSNSISLSDDSSLSRGDSGEYHFPPRVQNRRNNLPFISVPASSAPVEKVRPFNAPINSVVCCFDHDRDITFQGEVIGFRYQPIFYSEVSWIAAGESFFAHIVVELDNERTREDALLSLDEVGHNGLVHAMEVEKISIATSSINQLADVWFISKEWHNPGDCFVINIAARNQDSVLQQTHR